MVAANRAAVISNGVNTDCNHRNVSINPPVDIDRTSIQVQKLLINMKLGRAEALIDQLNTPFTLSASK